MKDPGLDFDLARFLAHFERLSRSVHRSIASCGLLEAEARIIFELGHQSRSQADLSRAVAMDTGQMARTIAKLRSKGLVEATRVGPQSLRKLISLTPAGLARFRDARQRQMVLIRAYLRDADDGHIVKLLAAARQIGERLWDEDKGPFVREAERGDIGLILRLASETLGAPSGSGLNDDVEVEIVERFLRFREIPDPYHRIFLVAEMWGEIVGGILVAGDRSTSTACIELLVVRPPYQGQGAGSFLLSEAMKRMKALGYRTFVASFLRSAYGPSFFSKHEWTQFGSRDEAKCGVKMTLEDWRWSRAG